MGASRLPRSAVPLDGDAIAWESSQGTTHGTVEKTVTSTTRIQGHVAKATPEHPEVLVKSAKTGAEAVHEPAALRHAKKAGALSSETASLKVWSEGTCLLCSHPSRCAT